MEEIKKSGELRVAARNRKAVALMKDGRYQGFHYCLATKFSAANHLALKVDIRPHSFQEYFTKKGLNLDDLIAGKIPGYVPDSLENNDIAIDGFNILPWREKVGRFVRLTHARQIVVYNKNRMKKPASIADLKGKTVYASAGTTQNKLADMIATKVPINLKVINVDSGSGIKADDLQPLISGNADFMIYPSTYALSDIKTNPNIGFGFPIGDSEPFYWMVEKSNDSLANELETFIVASKKNGNFDSCFKDEFGVSYNDYIRSLSILD
jgi:membrane-bound lytic murein transglycosylase MltF